MAQVSIGNHSKIVARHADQERIRAFYRGVLGCTLTKESKDVDYIRFHQNFFVAVLYQEEAASPEALRQSIWLELLGSSCAPTSRPSCANKSSHLA
jgi:hypothetical protein